MKSTDEPVIVQQVFQSPIADVWRAITDPKQMKEWFFENINSFESELGFETKFIVESEGRIFPHLWRISEVDPMKKISYNWKYEGYVGDSYVSFELLGLENQTTLRLTHQVVESFPAGIPEFTRESCIGGWEYFIHQRLKDYLEQG